MILTGIGAGREEAKEKKWLEEQDLYQSKKRRHERFAVRAGRPVTQLTSSFGVASLPPPQLEYIHHSIDWARVKYKNRNYFSTEGRKPCDPICI
jgi:hypothetical protein